MLYNLSRLRTVMYDPDEDYYLVVSTSDPTWQTHYRVNRLKDNKHWYCSCKGYQYSSSIPNECKHIKRVKIIDELRQKKKITIH